MKIRILRSFNYGDAGSPKHIIASDNPQNVPDDVPETMLNEWLRLGWVEWLPEWEGE